ncbi:hypothetical protein A8926_3680 [Saccharopolyspora spinosa]|uniref:Uncharacterized protein n=1 Tax=Saccharopolyspora spinosa TaxID=60894 RepID=A0A2N3XZ17_SACSN|nr:hypothetical protein A8926_3680 [Saccharopolyspora spinosa]
MLGARHARKRRAAGLTCRARNLAAVSGAPGSPQRTAPLSRQAQRCCTRRHGASASSTTHTPKRRRRSTGQVGPSSPVSAERSGGGRTRARRSTGRCVPSASRPRAQGFRSHVGKTPPHRNRCVRMLLARNHFRERSRLVHAVHRTGVPGVAEARSRRRSRPRRSAPRRGHRDGAVSCRARRSPKRLAADLRPGGASVAFHARCHRRHHVAAVGPQRRQGTPDGWAEERDLGCRPSLSADTTV